MIHLQRLSIQNFMSIGEVELNLHNRGLVLLVGENDIGKTAILEALWVILTGSLFRPGSIKDVHRRGSHDDTIIELETDQHLIKWKLDKQTLRSSLSMQYKSSDLPVCNTIPATRAIISSIFPSNPALLASTYIMLQPEAAHPMFYHLSRAQQYSVLSRLTEITAYETAAQRLLSQIKDIKADKQNLVDQINILSGELKSYEKMLPTAITSFNKETAWAEAQLRDIMKEAERDFSEEQAAIEKEVQKIQETISEKQHQLEEMTPYLEQYDKITAQMDEIVEKRKGLMAQRSNQFRVKSLSSDMVGKPCPVCRGSGQITQELIDRLAAERERITHSVTLLDKRFNELVMSRTKLERYRIEYNQIMNELANLNRGIDRATIRLQSIGEQMKRETERKKNLLSQRDDIVLRVERAQKHVETIKSHIFALKNRSDSLTNELKGIIVDIEYYEFVRDAFKHYIPAIRLERTCEELNGLCNMFNPELGIKWSPVNQNNELGITLEANTYLRGNGIQRLTALVTNLALSRIATKQIDVMMLDETLFPLRIDWKRQAALMLKEEARKRGTIFLVPAGESLRDVADDILYVSKYRGATRVD